MQWHLSRREAKAGSETNQTSLPAGDITQTTPQPRFETATIILPLYIYPLDKSTWQPLYDAITNHPAVSFVIIINPNSGPFAEYPNSSPGRLSLPGHDYCREIARLSAFSNVTLIGYIRINYCKKPLGEVFAEVETYAAWSREPGMTLQGIFVDETPNHYSPEKAEYLLAVKHGIKAIDGISGEKLVVHNPGTPPDHALAESADVLITCEEAFERYRGEEVQSHLAKFSYGRGISGCLISGVPLAGVGELTQTLRSKYAYLFVTDLVHNFYESFGESWEAFVAAVDTS